MIESGLQVLKAACLHRAVDAILVVAFGVRAFLAIAIDAALTFAATLLLRRAAGTLRFV
ncbi:MAG TPA: hypothetical protein VFF64_03620 [Candidatus Eremiobacteraceae bacterium]|nr:hypothetical protein [Candidatus Eremiobacteraceae bacterium]